MNETSSRAKTASITLRYLGPHAHPEISIHTHLLAEYVDCLERGVFRPEAVASFQGVIERMKTEGCDAVVPGYITGTKKNGRNPAMPACAISPSDRRKQVSLIGNDLLRHYGKKPYYTVEQVKNANRRQGIQADFGCWSHATFNTHEDFDSYHQTLGESCDYLSMKGNMLSSVSTGGDSSWFDLDLSWLQFPDIDLSAFDFFDI